LAEKRPQELERFRRSMEFSMQDAVGYLRAVRNQLLALEAHVSSISTKARSLAQDRSILSIKLRQLPVLFNSADFILQFSALFTSQARTSELHVCPPVSFR
jgi:hypothetical protein